MPKAPGSWTSLIVAALAWFLLPASWVAIPVWLAIYLIGVHAATQAEKDLGHDSGKIVIDEALGMGVALIFIPKVIWFYLAGFFLFRILDIYKPLGIRSAEKLPRGWGVMTDDLLAGVYANLILQLVFKLVITIKSA
ncbi:MAG: phosphatidylglycerophosphatase A [candidate division Zixibacteria bacterium]|nr:phosphatidylglycerophosphatase A [candidate division Zixibacteria bacterium]